MVCTIPSKAPRLADGNVTTPLSPRFNLFENTLTTAVARWNIPLTRSRIERLHTHYVLMVEANRVMNLTRIIQPVEAAIKHYADSLALLRWVKQSGLTVRTVLDIGTGAGFPSVPLAILQPNWRVTAIDATRRKIEFIREIADRIGLSNLCLEHAHSDHWRPSRSFELVVTRAAGRLPRCLPGAARLLDPGGWFIAYKTARVGQDELRDAGTTLRRLPLRVQEPFPYELDCEGRKLRRVLYVYRRVG